MRHLQVVWRFVYLALIGVGLMGPLAAGLRAAPVAEAGTATVYVLTFKGAVTPVLDRYLKNGIEAAQAAGAEAIILQLDTPGGSVTVTQNIVQHMLAAPVPIVVYVAPAGAHAGSAGTFITLAGHVAAMAPGSSIGAASPVGLSGEEVQETMAAKVENILSADIENLATRRGEEAVAWAIAAVRDAEAATARRALELGVIDFVADNVDDLLEAMDGFQVTVNGQPRTLHTADAAPIALEMGPLQRFLNFITDPSVASILLSLGTLALIVELRAPGFGVPGIVGIICMLLAFYALGQLDANLTGLALVAVAVALFIAEALTPTFGVLAVGGAIAFILGAMLLFDTPDLRVPWPTLLLLAGGLAGFTIFAGGKALMAQRRPAMTGGEMLIGQVGKAKQAFKAGEPGSVFVAGEWWNAELESGEAAEGDPVEIVGRRGYTLIVRRAA